MRLHGQPGVPRGLDVQHVHGSVRSVSDSPDSERSQSAAGQVEKAEPVASAEPAAAQKSEDPRATGPLAPAWAALERGDHVEAAKLARELAKSDDETIRNDAEAFLQRLRPDPVILMVFAGTGLLILLLAWQYLGHRH